MTHAARYRTAKPAPDRIAEGLRLYDAGRLAEAEPMLRATLAADPGALEARLRLATLAGLRGDAAAAAGFRAVLARAPDHVAALAGLAALEEAAGRLVDAAALLARAVAAAPQEPELLLAQARLALARGDAAAAERGAAAVFTLLPHHVGAARLVADALAGLPAAAALARIAEHAAEAPFAAGWPLAAAAIHRVAGAPADALAELRLAAALAPDEPEVAGELGALLTECGGAQEALPLLEAAARARPTDVEARNRLATALWRQQRFVAMRAVLDAAIADFGAQPALLVNRALALNGLGEQDGALRAADAAVAAGGGYPALLNRVAVLPYHPERGGPAALLDAARALTASLGPPPPRLAPPAAGPDRPLRVGLLSGGLGVHPVGWLTIAGLEALGPEFTLSAFSLLPRRDRLTERFRARCVRWQEVGGLDDAAIAARIAADGVDIVLELGGHGEGGRPFVLRHRPAPVAIKWVGAQFGSLALPGLDWWLTDARQTPPGSEPHYAERLLRLPHGYVCYLPPGYAPPVVPPPALTRGHVTFGSCNNLAKITPVVLAAWARILAAVPNARLLLRTHALSEPETRAAVQARLREAGLPPDRVRLEGRLPHPELLASYADVDIALDTFPYTGGLTTIEALWMGVPTVALEGESFCARHSLAHLGNVGLDDWVAPDVDGYVALAVGRARDLAGLAALRAGLRARVAASPLCDAPAFGQALEATLRHAWRTACAEASA